MNKDEDDSVGGSSAAAAISQEKPSYPGPKPGVKYPLAVIYCGGEYRNTLFDWKESIKWNL